MLHGWVVRKSLGGKYDEAFQPANHTTAITLSRHFAGSVYVLSNAFPFSNLSASHTRLLLLTPTTRVSALSGTGFFLAIQSAVYPAGFESTDPSWRR